jgi:F-type H+-transporting ATPase subunit c
MNKRHVLLASTLVLLLTPNLAFAQDAAANIFSSYQAIAISAGFGMAIAAAVCGYAQSKAIAAALEGIARNPSAAGAIRGAMIFGLVLIESLAIYALLIAILLIFMFAGGTVATA